MGSRRCLGEALRGPERQWLHSTVCGRGNARPSIVDDRDPDGGGALASRAEVIEGVKIVKVIEEHLAVSWITSTPLITSTTSCVNHASPLSELIEPRGLRQPVPAYVELL